MDGTKDLKEGEREEGLRTSHGNASEAAVRKKQ